MTTNSQNLTFGEWLGQVGVSPDSFAALPQNVAEFLFIDWQDGDPPAVSRTRLAEWRSKPQKCGCGGLCDSGHPCPMEYNFRSKP